MFVGRRPDGTIYGTWTVRQPDDEFHQGQEELPDDHPDVIEFMKDVPTQAHMTPDDFKREKEDQERVDKELPQLQALVQQHSQAWTELETALSALLYMTLNIQPKSSHIAYAIYYGLNGFDARQTVVNNAIIQLMDENKDLEPMRDLWTKLDKKLQDARGKRNTIVHGIVQTLIYGSKPRKKRAVLSPLPFDVIRIGRRIKLGEDPGMNVKELLTAVQKVVRLRKCIDAVNTVIGGFHKTGEATLPKTIPALEASLTALNNP